MAVAKALYEYRLTLPFTAERLDIGLLYNVARSSLDDVDGGTGVEFVRNEPVEIDGRMGQYTEKVYKLRSIMPPIVAAFIPKRGQDVREVCYNAFPHIKTTITNPLLASFELVVETLVVDGDRGHLANALGLDAEDLELRQVVPIDILDGQFDKEKNYEEAFDPRRAPPPKTSSVPNIRSLAEKDDWWDVCEPVCTVYKVVSCRISASALGKRITNAVCEQYHDVFLRYHRRVYVWADSWFRLTKEEIRRMETETKAELDRYADGK